MSGAMMDRPLTPLHFLDRAADLFGRKTVVAADADGAVARTWREVRTGAVAATATLRTLGVAPGDRVAVLAWNTHRHLELYFAVPAARAVLLTVNVRLAPAQVRAILHHAGVRVVLAEAEFTSLVDAALDAGDPGTEDDGGRPPAGQGAQGVAGAAGAAGAVGHAGADAWTRVVLDGPAPGGWRRWEDLTGGAEAPEESEGTTRVGWGAPGGEPAEDDPAGLCYTSGTTGEPKGVLYTHRALALHTLAICLPDGFGLGEADVILPAVPMFHANGWGLPHAAAMTGATLVLPGPRPTAERLADLLSERRVTFAAGVPTVWMGVLDALRRRPRPLAPELRIHAGGAPSPPALVEAWRRDFGVEVVTGWGMTELTPVGMVTHPRGAMVGAPPEDLLAVRTSQGTPLPFVEARLVDDRGRAVPRDGATPGELEVRGPWVTAGYYRRAGGEAFRDGWLRTGDVATMDADGYVRLVDRTKDLIRSGGEWISSVQLEHLLMGHPDVAEAVVVAVPDPRWGERPWATVVLRPGASADPAAILACLDGAVPSWWVPDRVVTADAVPLTATGKYDKKALRARYRARLEEEGRGGV